MSNINPKSYDYLIKFVLVGDANCGKTSLISQFCDNYFDANYLTTIGVDFKFKTIDLNNKRVKVQIWDTAGQERFRSITQSYYRGSHVVLLVFDLTNKDSLKNIEYWYENVIDNIHGENPQIYLIGNKNDLNDITVNKKDVKNIIKNTKIKDYFEVSAKENNGLKEMFDKICEDCVENNMFKNNLFIANTKPKSSCCNIN